MRLVSVVQRAPGAGRGVRRVGLKVVHVPGPAPYPLEPGSDVRVGLEENAEELVEILLKAARAGEWRVVAMMWDRIYGRPKESVTVETEEPEAIRALRALTPEQRMTLWQNRGLSVVDDEPQEETA